jgi:alkylresorcinol/alkylpyrone synthase
MLRKRRRAVQFPTILAVATATPPNRFSQAEILALAGYRDSVRRGFFRTSGIAGRYLAIDRESFQPGETVDAMQERFRKAAPDLAARAAARCLERAGRAPRDVDFVATTTCTGRLCPSLDTLLVRDLCMRPDVQRVHVGDTGCAAAMVALQQACNYLQAHSACLALVVAAEVCSATYYLDDTLETAVANAIFADGAGAVLLGCEGAGPRVVAHRTLLIPDALDLMGFTYPGGRPRIVLSKDIRHRAAEVLGAWVHQVLEAHGLGRHDIRHWVLHSAGHRILEAAQRLLGLTAADLAFSRQVLSAYGNMSSATVLFVLEAALAAGRARPGDRGIMAALGPGFAAEGALLRW